MTNEHQIGDTIVLYLLGTIAGATTDKGEIRAYRVRLDVGGEISLTREQLAAAADAGQALDLLLGHVRTGEPLSEDEVATIVEAGLSAASDFNSVGGDLHRHVLLRDGELRDVR